MSENKIEVMYFYSDFNENEKILFNIRNKIRKERKDIEIRLVNIDDPGNKELTDVYRVNSVPLLVFLTPKGKIAARRSLPLSAEDIVNEISDRINKGELPNSHVENIRTKILETLKTVTKRNELVELAIEQIDEDLVEANLGKEIVDLIGSHISAINHTISDLQELRKVLQKFFKREDEFVI